MTWQAAPHPDDVRRVVAPPAAAPEPARDDIRRRGRRQPVVLRPRADTPQVSTLQLLPLLVPVLSLAAVLFSRGWSLSTVAGLAVAVSVIQFVVARRDRHHLGERGFIDRAPASAALVSPVLYLWLRGRSCEGHDPDAPQAVRWAVGTTAASAVVLVVATWFFAAITEGIALVWVAG